MPAFSTRTSFWLAGAVVALALWSSASPSMTYPLYQSQWGISSTTAAWVFAAYPLALIPVLVLLGDVSDHIGRRLAIILGLVAQLLGVLCFVGAADVAWLLLGRALMGLGVGLSLSPANVAMVEFSPAGHEGRASAVATAVSAVGIALAMVVGGALTEYAPVPMRLHFVVLAVSLAVVAVLVLGMPRHARHPETPPWRVRTVSIPRGRRFVFSAGAVAFTSSFLLGTIVLPQGARIAQQLAGSSNTLATGALLSVFAGCIAVTSLLARRLGEWTLVTLGALGSVAAVWLYVATGAAHSLAVFFAASACAGIAYAFSFAGGLTVLSRYAAPRHRASMVSGGYLVGYLAQGLGAPALGWLMGTRGLLDGLRAGAIAYSVFFVCALALGLAARRATRDERAQRAADASAVSV